jgi:hypothetical protein
MLEALNLKPKEDTNRPGKSTSTSAACFLLNLYF